MKIWNMRSFYFIVSLLISFQFLIFAQNADEIVLNTSKGTSYIPVYIRQGIIYFSINHFADATSASYYINDETKKIELKYPKHNLKITGQNPFLILTSKDNKTEKIFQLPTSTYILNNNIYIPLRYAINILREASGAGYCNREQQTNGCKGSAAG